MIEVTWLEKKSSKNNYMLGKKDIIMGKSVVCEIKLNKINRFVYVLPDDGKKFILEEIKYILEQEKIDSVSENDSVEQTHSLYDGDCENGNNESIPVEEEVYGNESGIVPEMAVIGDKFKHNDSENIDIKMHENECNTTSITSTNKSVDIDSLGPGTIGAQNGSFEIKPCEQILISEEEVKNLEYSRADTDILENKEEGFDVESNNITTDMGLLSTQNMNLKQKYEYEECSDPTFSESFEEIFEESGSEYLPSEDEDVLENNKNKPHTKKQDTYDGDVNPSKVNELQFSNLIRPSTSVGEQKGKPEIETCKKIKILQNCILKRSNLGQGYEDKECSGPVLSKHFEESGSDDLPSEDENAQKFSKKKKRRPKNDTTSHKRNKSERDADLDSSEVKALNYKNSYKSSDIKISLDIMSKQHENKRIYDKIHCCYLCNKKCLKMARHLELKHPSEVAVAKILAKEKNSSDRRKAFLELIRVGDFYHNMEVLSSKNGTLILCRRPPVDTVNILTYNDFGPCPYCLGFMAKSFLLRHAKVCTSEKSPNNISLKSVRTASNSLVNSMLFKGEPKFRSQILDTFCNDKISAICRTDSVILGVGMLLFEKHANSQKELIRQSMRQLGRLLQVIRGSNPKFTNKELKYFIDPIHFDVIVNSVKTLCKANMTPSEKTDYGIPSLALKIGHSLRKCAAFLKGQSLRVGDFKVDKKLSSFLQLLDLEWEIRVSSNALSTLVKRKINSATLLPLTEDLMKLNNFLAKEISIFQVLLQNNPCETVAWLKLAQATLSRIILFNKRRGGEMSRITLSQYASNPNWSEESTQELQESLTPLERELAKSMKLVQIPGKRGRTVPVLLREEMVSAINLLISTRLSVGVNPHNPYIFARPNKDSLNNIRGPDALRSVVERAGLISPQAITSTKLRKYTATVCQVFNLQERELDWLARHMGHDVRVHRDFYRLHESAVELTKISRILMTVDTGEVSKFKGRSLEEIGLQGMF